jgi:hypothetical protein
LEGNRIKLRAYSTTFRPLGGTAGLIKSDIRGTPDLEIA